MRYFILADYLIPPFLRFDDQYASTSRGLGREFYVEHGYSIPRNYTLARLDDGAAVRVVFFDADRGLMMIRAASMRSAYAIATAIHGYMAVWLGYGPDRHSPTYFLYPIRNVPTPEWTEEEMKAALEDSDWSFGDSEWFRLNHLGPLSRSWPPTDGFWRPFFTSSRAVPCSMVIWLVRTTIPTTLVIGRS